MKKKLKRVFSDKRAITPVLSNLLLAVVAVAAMAIATTATQLISTNLRETMSERIIVEDLWFNNSTGNINVYLRNIGKVAIHVSAVYVNHTSQPFTKPFRLEVDENGWLNISCSWASGSLYYVDIVTARGTHVADHHKAP
jgi:FlaG/FlaF family flagellin (archaellin)